MPVASAPAVSPAYCSYMPAPPSSATPLMSGAVLQGRYRIVRVLGSGAFGRVYLADDMQDPSTPQVAIKELLDSQYSTEEEKRDAIIWFKREVSTLLTLEHPGIPTIHGYWTARSTAGPFYLAMDYIPGKTLEELLDLAGGRVLWELVKRWGIALCEILAYLHERKPPFVFRDMKLPNVMLDERTNSPVLIDFGIARHLASAKGTAIGTWGYVPDEQWDGKAEPRSDLYALGATMHALITGLRPDSEYMRLQRNGHDRESAMRALFPPVDSIVPGVPKAFAAALERATAFDAKDRFPDAHAMAAALQSGQSGLRVQMPSPPPIHLPSVSKVRTRFSKLANKLPDATAAVSALSKAIGPQPLRFDDGTEPTNTASLVRLSDANWDKARDLHKHGSFAYWARTTLNDPGLAAKLEQCDGGNDRDAALEQALHVLEPNLPPARVAISQSVIDCGVLISPMRQELHLTNPGRGYVRMTVRGGYHGIRIKPSSVGLKLGSSRLPWV